MSPTGRLENRVAFITGGARGQGAELARRFAQEGADIIISDLCAQIATVPYPLSTPDDLAAVKEEVERLGRRCVAEIADVRDQEQLDAVVGAGLAEFGRIDIACANAGITGSLASMWEMTDAQWNDLVGVNLTGVWHTVKAVAPTMIAQKSGALILTASVNGYEALPDYCHYVATKHGVLGLAKAAALELGPHNVRVNSILPGPVNTPMINNSVMNDYIAGFKGATAEEMLNATRSWNLLAGRVALPVEAISNAALFLASDAADHIHGAELVIDSGHLIMPAINQNPVA